MALTRQGAPFVWTNRQQQAFEALKACLVSAPILGFPTQNGRFVLDTDASLFAVGGVLSQLQDDREVVIAYASRSLRLSQRRYCTTCREMLAAVVMCTHFLSYLRGTQLTLHTDHSSLRWLQRFRNEDGMLARWYLLLGQFSVTIEYQAPPSAGSQLVVPQSERRSMIRRFHDSLFAGHLGISRTVFCLFVCTGPDYDRTFELMWHLALCASQGNPHAPGGRQWDM